MKINCHKLIGRYSKKIDFLLNEMKLTLEYIDTVREINKLKYEKCNRLNKKKCSENISKFNNSREQHCITFCNENIMNSINPDITTLYKQIFDKYKNKPIPYDIHDLDDVVVGEDTNKHLYYGVRPVAKQPEPRSYFRVITDNQLPDIDNLDDVVDEYQDTNKDLYYDIRDLNPVAPVADEDTNKDLYDIKPYIRRGENLPPQSGTTYIGGKTKRKKRSK